MNPFQETYTSDKSDIELIKKSIDGDKDAIAELLKVHQPYIYNVAWKMVRNPDDAADITQEVIVKIITKLSTFSFKSNFRTWAYRIVVNHFLQQEKQKMEMVFNSFEAVDHTLNVLGDNPLSEIEQEERMDEVREMNLMCMSGMLLCLTREQRIIYILGEMFAASHTIGSEILEISKDNFRTKLSKARKDMYNFMNNRCGLVNKSNPCRCHKKVTVAVERGVLDAKNLLFNKKEYSDFQQFISSTHDLDYEKEEKKDQYRQLYREMSYKNDFDKKTFIEEILNSEELKRKLNL